MEQAELYADHEFVPVVRHPGGWALAFVHYSADPKKDEEWAAKAKARGDVEDWEKEMDINFQSVEGVRCFENFSLISNTTKDIELDESAPICLCCDFNVEPMCWLVCQITESEELRVIDEIWMKEGSVIQNCQEFLNRYGDFYGQVRIYGDASGGSRGQQDNQKSNYDVMKLQFIRAPFTLRMKVPRRNPSNINSVAAMNLRLKDKFGNPRVQIHSENCPNLIRDMVEVVWEEGKKAIKKVRKKDKPYFWRTHAADALMAIVNREWPTRTELSRKTEEEKKHDEARRYKGRRRRKKKLLGAIGG
jgi:hypothetical protein